MAALFLCRHRFPEVPLRGCSVWAGLGCPVTDRTLDLLAQVVNINHRFGYASLLESIKDPLNEQLTLYRKQWFRRAIGQWRKATPSARREQHGFHRGASAFDCDRIKAFWDAAVAQRSSSGASELRAGY